MKFTFVSLSTLLLLFLANIGQAQQVTIEGYVYEENNRGYLNEVKIMVLKLPIKSVVAKDIYSNLEGKFEIVLPAGEDYLVRATKDIFKTKEVTVSTKGSDAKVYAKLEMERKPGYLFEATLAEKRTNPDQVVDAIQGSLIEIYNNTTEKEELVLENHPDPAFSYTFEQGNHYTIMIRKDGYLAKRIEAYVNINGCIVCIDGVRNAGPGVVDVMTHGFDMGTLLANIELDRADLNTKIAVDNIYYDLAKWDIREEAAEELDKVVTLMNDNPEIIVELGSHTDSRGGDSYNLDLSQKRANAAVEYITQVGGITTDRIQSKGYGETQLVNRCKNGVKCSESKHQKNRRTELKIVGFKPKKRAWKSLEMIVREENFMKESGDFVSGQIKIGEDGTAIRSDGSRVKIDDVIEKIPLSEKVVKTKVETPQVKEVPQVQEEIIAQTQIQTQAPIQQKTQVEIQAEMQRKAQAQKQISEEQKVNEAIGLLQDAKIIDPTTGEIGEVLVSKGNISTQTQTTIERQATEQMRQQTQVQEVQVATNQGNVSQSSGTVSGQINTQSTGRVATPSSAQINASKYVHQLLPSNYSGYKVEVVTSVEELTADHPIFHNYGPVTVERTPDGGFAYLLGDFTSERIAVYFLNNSIIDDYGSAKLVEFVGGKRIYR